MASQVTQCPKCHTSFRVTESQLTIANGAVRCGSCLHIFNAPDHWLEPVKSTSNSAENPDDQPLFHDTSEQEALERIFEDNEDLQLIDDNFQVSPDKKPCPPTPQQQDAAPIADDMFIDDDILIDDDMLIDDDTEFYGDTRSQPYTTIDKEELIGIEDLHPDSTTAITNDNFSETFLDLDKWEQAPASIFKELDDLGDTTEAKEDQWAEQLLKDDTDDQPIIKAQSFEEIPDIHDTSDHTGAPCSDDITEVPANDQDNVLQAQEDEFILGDEPMLAGEPIGNSHHSLLASIEPEPVVMSGKMQHNTWRQRGWSLAIVVALLLFATQYVYFNFNALARDPQLRPVLGSVCNIVGCALPGLDDITLIRSSNLMVRSHPSAANALVVDAILTNRASFKQHFPVMELQFTDLSGKLVASRRFKPDEYLSGELIGVSKMPVKQPVHISLEIVDPGQNAVNYQLYFHTLHDS